MTAWIIGLCIVAIVLITVGRSGNRHDAFDDGSIVWKIAAFIGGTMCWLGALVLLLFKVFW